eukprot:3480675-Amphidinium_carterae.1
MEQINGAVGMLDALAGLSPSPIAGEVASIQIRRGGNYRSSTDYYQPNSHDRNLLLCQSNSGVAL